MHVLVALIDLLEGVLAGDQLLELELAGAIQLEQQRVRCVEDIVELDADSDQRVDVEEAPVVDLVRGDPPVGETVGLGLDQLVQEVEAPGIARGPAEGPEPGREWPSWSEAAGWRPTRGWRAGCPPWRRFPRAA